jgi:hypothetical protein
VDGGDSKSFATQLDLANNIEGPLTITGGMTDDRSADLEREPVMLLGETNFKPEIGSVIEADSFHTTIDIDEVVDGTAATDTITQGGSLGLLKVITNTDGRTTPTPANEVQLLTVDAVSGTFGLWLDVNKDGKVGDFLPVADPGHAKEVVWDIEYDPDDIKGVATAIEAGLNSLDNLTVEDIWASDGAFLIEMSTTLPDVNLPSIFPFPDFVNPPWVVKVGVFVDSIGSSSAETVKQDLAVYGNDGEFVLRYNTSPITYETTDPIAFDPTDENQADKIKTAIQAAIDKYPGHAGVTVEVNGSSSHYQVVFTNATTPVTIYDLEVDSQSLTLNEVQTLAINASGGTFKLQYESSKTGELAWDITATALEDAIKTLTYTVIGFAQGDGTGPSDEITLAGWSSAADDYYNGVEIEIIAGAGAGDKFTRDDYDGTTKIATIDGTWSTNPDFTSIYRMDVPFKDVSVKLDIDPVRAERLYTITFLDPGNVGFEQLEVVENVKGQPEEFKLERTVKEAIETKLVMEEVLVSPEQLIDYTIEIVKYDAKNKIRLISDGTSEDRWVDLDGDDVDDEEHTFFILEVDRPWEGGLTREIPDSDSLFTIENTNPNLLVDENEETDILYLNDDDSVVSFKNPRRPAGRPAYGYCGQVERSRHGTRAVCGHSSCGRGCGIRGSRRNVH